MTVKKQYEPKWMKARSTSQARRAISDFVNDNADNLSEWLQRVAYGMPKTDEAGAIIRDHQGSVVYVVKPDPATAIKAVSDIMEYHLPKLSRTEATVTHNSNELDVTQMSTDELKLLVLRQAGIDADTIDLDQIIDAEPVKTK